MTTFACLALMRFDQLRLVGFPPQANDWISQAILRAWPDGISAGKAHPRCYEIKLGGTPWAPKGHDAMHARFLMLEILTELKRHGYTLHSSSDVANSERARDTLVFRHGLLEESPAMFAISTNASDLLRLLRAPAELEPVVEQLIARHWPPGLHRKTLDVVPGCAEFKFRECPWAFNVMHNMNDDDSDDARIFLLHLFATLEERGWHLYGSIGQATSIFSDGRAKDTCYFYHAVPFAVPVVKVPTDPMAPSAPAFMA
ncbi:hypothetical protein SPRG_00105 [Saprolegnia parasitica CBS 223.65]|uniref:Uncharacterized protein n=1 Tax=Saprolegnia parasitica (strain CBS 223.65) TaxID=695850 RepID=A0A067CX49_SAPPC|nr:hypothetical protein SPRG_00105 [Saprolegnia parasitica CBS 223.65]KDO35259.1 hypothetical protein SPRG_00105 [Saprolegnia parasitica CBS 223.65]|eukprot:XP_012193610.1 hypothetical protein SPRG_00105 [Saprolegnia parasitica CBS 223.65]